MAQAFDHQAVTAQTRVRFAPPDTGGMDNATDFPRLAAPETRCSRMDNSAHGGVQDADTETTLTPRTS